MLLFNCLFYYPLITRQVGCEIALTAVSVWPLYFQVVLFISPMLS